MAMVTTIESPMPGVAFEGVADDVAVPRCRENWSTSSHRATEH